MIGGNDDKAIAAHLESTHDFADKVLKSADEDPNDAFLKAVGILAQVIFVTVNGEHREAHQEWPRRGAWYQPAMLATIGASI